MHSVYLPPGGSLRGAPTTHTFGNLFGSRAMPGWVSEKHIWSAPECKEKSSEGKDEVLHTYIRPLDEALASGPDGICVFQT
uniref:Uncharacterized protein n=1 Tax=Candidatus Kentrum sp. LPFa TaxID=2126335 RepID=A0A450WJU1_9GAMM|nr:MAG: hypothetical protein BECKLPF1236A_GA0070988_101672 [Candidatus Kentron sp. LPFa]VFK34145.1 MAG: hypothetical protein BECKLPF1236C_GA0070990_102477 [Candidatus Kentron sp. LPFa]